VKWSHDVDCSLPSNAKVIEWSYNSSPPICLHGMDRDNFTQVCHLALFLFHLHQWMKGLKPLLSSQSFHFDFMPTLQFFLHVFQYLTKPNCSWWSHRSVSYKLILMSSVSAWVKLGMIHISSFFRAAFVWNYYLVSFEWECWWLNQWLCSSYVHILPPGSLLITVTSLSVHWNCSLSTVSSCCLVHVLVSFLKAVQVTGDQAVHFTCGISWSNKTLNV
jgi:hypothetical protein